MQFNLSHHYIHKQQDNFLCITTQLRQYFKIPTYSCRVKHKEAQREAGRLPRVSQPKPIIASY